MFIQMWTACYNHENMTKYPGPPPHRRKKKKSQTDAKCKGGVKVH